MSSVEDFLSMAMRSVMAGTRIGVPTTRKHCLTNNLQDAKLKRVRCLETHKWPNSRVTSLATGYMSRGNGRRA